MVIRIKKGKPVGEMIRKLNELVSKKNRGLQSKKYSGKVRTQIDPIEYQKSMRNEWE